MSCWRAIQNAGLLLRWFPCNRIGWSGREANRETEKVVTFTLLYSYLNLAAYTKAGCSLISVNVLANIAVLGQRWKHTCGLSTFFRPYKRKMCKGWRATLKIFGSNKVRFLSLVKEDRISQTLSILLRGSEPNIKERSPKPFFFQRVQNPLYCRGLCG